MLRFRVASSNLETNSLRHSSSFRLPPASHKPLYEDGLGWRLQLLVFGVAVLAVVSRRPDAVFNPQFFAEDGPLWYANAYTFGWLSSLLHPQNGYFQTLPRLAASLALLAPLRYAPLVMNLVGITFQVLPVNLLLSRRCADWGTLPARLFMGAIYIALPNSFELNASVEEGQWHLALLACILILARPPGNSLMWRVFDLSIILLSGLTGPFCILLLPVALVFWWVRRGRFRRIVIGAITLAAAIQITAIVQTSSATRPQVGLGATPRLFIELLTGHVYLAALFGQFSFRQHHSILALSIVALLGTAVLVYCLLRAPLEFKLFVCFALLVFAVSLLKPMVSMTVPQWQVLEEAVGIRYWFFPMLAFSWSLVWAACDNSAGAVRIPAACALMCLFIGVARDWRYQPYVDFHFPEYARRFDSAPPGAMIDIPIYPPGWMLRLTKKSPLCTTFPVGYTEQPTPDSRLSGHATVTGWAAAPTRIQQIVIYVDRVRAQSAQLTLARGDIDGLYPQSPNEHKGWSTVLDVSGITAGKHELEIRAHEIAGCEADIGLVPVEVR